MVDASNRDDEKTRPPKGSSLEDPLAIKLLSYIKPVMPCNIGRIHGIGRRGSQQDSLGVSDIDDIEAVKKKGVLTIVADGMGGLSDGDLVSSTVVVTMLEAFDHMASVEYPASSLLEMVCKANEKVNMIMGNERIGKCGSTVVATIIQNKKLSYISIGDSRIYLYRKEKIYRLNKEHNYGTQLDDKVLRGEISADEALTAPHRNALTSFIGMGSLEYVDQNETPIELETYDRILLMSDGVYGTVDDSVLTNILKLSFKESLIRLNDEIIHKNKEKQDNYTCIMLEIK